MRRSAFTAVKTEGGLFPADFLQKLTAASPDVSGLTSEAYHLTAQEKLNEAASRAWNRLLGIWAAFQDAIKHIPRTEAATGLTRDKWLLPLFMELGYGRLQPAKAVEIENRSYPVSHRWQNVPIHLVGVNVDLDRRSAGVAGAARISPHGLVQELLNHRTEALWGFVSNGMRLRLLRDNRSLSRQAYVEFDLAAMMDGQAFSDFVLLWVLCHESRVEGELSEECWLEKWAKAAREQGTRALEELRVGVEHSIEALGRGFLKHPSNRSLLEKLYAGSLDRQDYYRQLLRLVYRLIFLFVAEARDLLLLAEATSTESQRYLRYYSVSRLRELASRKRGTPHGDLWKSLLLIFRGLSSVGGCPELALPGLGSFLWSDGATPDLDACALANTDLLEAIRALAFRLERGIRRAVDWRNLGSEELGSVYEALLELHPEVNTAGALFSLRVAAGHERRETGSYYTPTSLVECLLDSALDPVLVDAAKSDDPERAILNLKVCDPAAGSGHFLIAAAHRIARRLAALRTGDAEASPEAVRHALRDVIGHCLYGVDMNPMAVELCKVNLWLEALEPGRPLSFLDHHIQCGNSLLGATPALLRAGIPDAAFEAMEGDDREYCRDLKRWNRTEREGHQNLFTAEPWNRIGDLAAGIANLDKIDDSKLDGVREKERRYAEIVSSANYEQGRLLADAWCAAFVWPKTREAHPIGEDLFRLIERNPMAVPEAMRGEIKRLATQYRFFHWHLSFPEVFRVAPVGESGENAEANWSGGFDVVLGNPPWVRQELLKSLKNLLSVYPSFSSTADLSVFFLDLGISLLAHRGRCALLTPNKWFRAAYGARLREHLRARSRIHLIIDFGHTKTLFPEADTFPACLICSRVSRPVSDEVLFKFVSATDEQRAAHSLNELIAAANEDMPHGRLLSVGWIFNDRRVEEILQAMRSRGKPLAEAIGASPLYGLKTGFNEAFYLDDQSANGLVSYEPQSAELLKRFVRGRDVKRWTVEWAQLWHIVIPSSHNRPSQWADASTEEEAEQLFAAAHPMLYSHLKNFESALRRRTDQGKYWWELRSCNYYDEFEQPKIIVARIAFHSSCGLDTVGYFQNDSTVLIPCSDLFVLAVLNSRLAWWYMTRVFPHKKDEALSMDADYLERMPIPDVDESTKDSIREKCHRLLEVTSQLTIDAGVLEKEKALSSAVWAAYGLNLADESILDELPVLRDPVRVLADKATRPHTSQHEPPLRSAVASRER